MRGIMCVSVVLGAFSSVHASPLAASSLPTCAWNPHQNSLAKVESIGCFGAGVIFLRENTLPLCDWGDPGRSYEQLVHDAQGGPGAWQCVDAASAQRCVFQNGKPTSSVYGLIPATSGEPTIRLANGSALYGVQRLECISSHSSAPSDTLHPGDLVRGLGVPPFDCSGLPGHAATLIEIDGGAVQHVRPALVRGQATLRIHNSAGTRAAGVATQVSREMVQVSQPDAIAASAGTPPKGRNIAVILAVQVFGNNGWVDHTIKQFTVAGKPTLLEIQDQIEPGTDVRLQVRGTTCQYASPEGYDIRDARIQVETCIPDQSNPGACL